MRLCIGIHFVQLVGTCAYTGADPGGGGGGVSSHPPMNLKCRRKQFYSKTRCTLNYLH